MTEEEITAKVQQEIRAKLLKELEAKSKAEEEARIEAEENKRKAEKKATVDALIEKANQGSIEAIRTLANDYYVNDDEYKDYELAFQWYSRGAEMGDVSCMVSLGEFCYNQGNGTEENTQMAIHWLTKAADAENVEAMNKLAHIYSDKHEETNLVEAYKYFKLSADLGNYNSMANLGGFCYLQGHGTEKNMYKAIEWLYKCLLHDMSAACPIESLKTAYRFTTVYEEIQKDREYIAKILKQLRGGDFKVYSNNALFDRPIYILSDKDWTAYTKMYNNLK